MALRLVRVDDRLIHGQVIAVWLRAVGADRIVIVDDDTARDEFLSEVLLYAAPPGVEVEVYDVDAAAPRVIALAASDERVFVLMKSPITAERLRELGVEIPVLNVGGIGAAPNRKQLYRNISASPEELECLKRLDASGTSVQFQIVADDHPVALSSVT
jgi:PTS system mannose-specific IIB component